jgi:hypothetical protein
MRPILPHSALDPFDCAALRSGQAVERWALDVWFLLFLILDAGYWILDARCFRFPLILLA